MILGDHAPPTSAGIQHRADNSQHPLHAMQPPPIHDTPPGDSTSLARDSASPHPSVWIDYASYPHIVDNILHLAPDPALLSFRACSRRLRDLADAQLVSHLVATPTAGVPKRRELDYQHPGMWSAPRSGIDLRTPANLRVPCTKYWGVTWAEGQQAFFEKEQWESTGSGPPAGPYITSALEHACAVAEERCSALLANTRVLDINRGTKHTGRELAEVGAYMGRLDATRVWRRPPCVGAWPDSGVPARMSACFIDLSLSDSANVGPVADGVRKVVVNLRYPCRGEWRFFLLLSWPPRTMTDFVLVFTPIEESGNERDRSSSSSKGQPRRPMPRDRSGMAENMDAAFRLMALMEGAGVRFTLVGVEALPRGVLGLPLPAEGAGDVDADGSGKVEELRARLAQSDIVIPAGGHPHLAAPRRVFSRPYTMPRERIARCAAALSFLSHEEYRLQVGEHEYWAANDPPVEIDITQRATVRP